MILTLYSYKGGVGRSMALANLAEIILQGGLTRINSRLGLRSSWLRAFLSPRKETTLNNPGLIDMLVDYKQMMSQVEEQVFSLEEIKPLLKISTNI